MISICNSPVEWGYFPIINSAIETQAKKKSKTKSANNDVVRQAAYILFFKEVWDFHWNLIIFMD